MRSFPRRSRSNPRNRKKVSVSPYKQTKSRSRPTSPVDSKSPSESRRPKSPTSAHVISKARTSVSRASAGHPRRRVSPTSSKNTPPRRLGKIGSVSDRKKGASRKKSTKRASRSPSRVINASTPKSVASEKTSKSSNIVSSDGKVSSSSTSISTQENQPEPTKPPTTGVAVKMPRVCGVCTFINENNARNFCELCDSPLAAQVAEPVVEANANNDDNSADAVPVVVDPVEEAKAKAEAEAKAAEEVEAKAKAAADARRAAEAAVEDEEDESDEDEDEEAPELPALVLEGKANAMLDLLRTEERDYVIDNCKQQVPLSTLDNKIVCLYFSAHWCPPCRGFTPWLARMYRQLKALNQPFEIVFVSSDQDQAAFDGYFGSMPWLALPYSERKFKDELSQKFKIQGIPSLVIFDEFGKVFSTDGRSIVTEQGAEAFPWRPDPAIERAARAKFYSELSLVFKHLDSKKAGALTAQQLQKSLEDAKVVTDAQDRAKQMVKDVTADVVAAVTEEAWIAYFERLVKLNDDEIFSLNVLKSQFGLAISSDV